jgi:hypothetical protein
MDLDDHIAFLALSAFDLLAVIGVLAALVRAAILDGRRA